MSEQALVEELARVTEERDDAMTELNQSREECKTMEATIKSLRFHIEDILDIARRALK